MAEQELGAPGDNFRLVFATPPVVAFSSLARNEQEDWPMLRHLRISRFLLIEEAALDFDGGLTALTGETGAGKSTVLEALELLTGARAATSCVRAGAEKAVVQGIFDMPAGRAVAELLREAGVEPEEGEGELLLRREVLASGRSRAAVNGQLVPLALLQRLGEHLLRLCGQHAAQRLLQPGFLRDCTDAFLGLGRERDAVAQAHARVREAEESLAALEAEAADRERRRDFLAFQLEELEQAAVEPGEVERLTAERQRLGHVETLREGLAFVLSVLSEGEEGGEGASALGLAGSGAGRLAEMARLDRALKAPASMLGEACGLLDDVARALQSHGAALEADPARLNEVEERLALLQRILRKYGPAEEDAIARLAELREELSGIEQAGEAFARARQELDKARTALAEAAETLRAARHRGAKRFLRPLRALLHDFAMPKARVELAFAPLAGAGVELADGSRCAAQGSEEVELLFSANAGEEPRPFRSVASGGELSRLLLAIEIMTAGEGGPDVLVFDEVDTGISGRAASRVAERLAALGADRQVLCVTHAAAVAAQADRHLLATKHETPAGRTESALHWLPEEGRRAELARLLDGGKGSERSVALAEELLARRAG